MNNKGFNQEGVDIIQALSQERKKDVAVTQLKKLKNEFSTSFEDNTAATDPLTKIRIQIWKNNPNTKIRSISNNHITFEGIKLERVPSPPLGYAYKGGAARLALFELLGRNVGTKTPRDLDIVRIGNNKKKIDDIIASEFMEEDYKRGHGVEIINSIDNYMASRDLTINEILYYQDRIICSLQCLDDCRKSKLRFTNWCLRENNKPEPKVFVKALRFQAESFVEGLEYHLVKGKHETKVTPFDIALQLERCCLKNTRTAQKFCQLATQHSLLPKKYEKSSIGDIALYLSSFDKSLKKKFRSLFSNNNSKKTQNIKF